MACSIGPIGITWYLESIVLNEVILLSWGLISLRIWDIIMLLLVYLGRMTVQVFMLMLRRGVVRNVAGDSHLMAGLNIMWMLQWGFGRSRLLLDMSWEITIRSSVWRRAKGSEIVLFCDRMFGCSYNDHQGYSEGYSTNYHPEWLSTGCEFCQWEDSCTKGYCKFNERYRLFTLTF